MAKVTGGRIYGCDGHNEEGHELAGIHPVIVVGRQNLIDDQGIAIVVPLTSTRPNYPVHWAVEIADTDSSAHIRHIKSVHVTKIGALMGTATPEEIESIKEGLARELQYENHECAAALGREVRPGSLWSASIPNARGLSYEGELLILASNRDTGLVTALAIDPQPLGCVRTDTRTRLPLRPTIIGASAVLSRRRRLDNANLVGYNDFGPWRAL